MANKPKAIFAASPPPPTVAATAPVLKPVTVKSGFVHPDALELTKEDRERIATLAEQKRKAGLPYEQAVVSAEAQVREDKSGIYTVVRAAFNPNAK